MSEPEPTVIYVRGGIAEVWSSPEPDYVYIIDWDGDSDTETPPDDVDHVRATVADVAERLRNAGDESTARMLEQDYANWRRIDLPTALLEIADDARSVQAT